MNFIINLKSLIIILFILSICLQAEDKIKFINNITLLKKCNTCNKLKTIKIKAAFAQTPSQWQKGLMKVTKMKEKEGMLFIFNKEDYRVFWMKDTYIALDLIFLDKNLNIIGIKENNQPMSEKNIYIKKKAQYILELNAGFVKKYKIMIGDWLKI